VIVYVLVAKCRHRHQLPQTPNEILQILSVTILQKTLINELFSQEPMPENIVTNCNQLAAGMHTSTTLESRVQHPVLDCLAAMA
jgi:hypothetical protein